MRCSLVFVVALCLYVGKCSSIFTPNPTPSPSLNNLYNKVNILYGKKQIETNNYNIYQLLLLASVYVSLLRLSFLHLCNHVKYVTFDTNLCTRHKVTTAKLPDCFWSFWSLTMLGLLFCECPDFPLVMFSISINSSCGSVVNLTLRFGKIMSCTIFCILSIYIYSISLTPATCILSLVEFQIWCHSLTKKCTTLVTNHSDFIGK